jgi:hypothetical protein
MDNFLTSMSNTISTILQVPGGLGRDLVLMIPMPVAKGVFIAYFLILIFWVATLSREESVFQPALLKKEVSLKPFAIFSLSLMIVIYLIF